MLSLGLSCSADYLDLCVEIVGMDAGACNQAVEDIDGRARAWAAWLSPRIAYSDLARIYVSARAARADRWMMTPQEVTEHYNQIARAQGLRSNERCDYCTQGRITIFNLALQANVERWCPKCQTERAAAEPRLPVLRLADINPTVRQLVARDEFPSVPQTLATAYLPAILNAIGEYPDESGKYDYDDLLERGFCPTCRNTGYEMTRRSGSWGFSTVKGSVDHKTGYPTRRFVPCTCPKGEMYGGGERAMMPGATQPAIAPDWVR